KPLWRRAQSIGNRVVAEAQLNPDFPTAKPEKIRMRLRVIAYEMSARDGFFHQFRAFANVPTDQKKCGLRVVAVQQIEKLRSHRRIRLSIAIEVSDVGCKKSTSRNSRARVIQKPLGLRLLRFSVLIAGVSLLAVPMGSQTQRPEWQAEVRKYAEAQDWVSAIRIVD